jgi:hypothetical protein
MKMTEYPYMISNNKIKQIITQIQVAAKPQKFTNQVLIKLGFSSTNDRAVVPLLKKLSFLSEDGVPTSYYDQLRDKTTSRIIMGNRIRDLYADIFAINVNIHNDSEANIKGAISRVTGKDETGVLRIYNTFKALCNEADFEPKTPEPEQEQESVTDEDETVQRKPNSTPAESAAFHYNIQIHLPATTDISVYNAIFKSLKDHLII